MKLVDGSLTLRQALSYYFFLRHLYHQIFTFIFPLVSFLLWPLLNMIPCFLLTSPSVLRKASVSLCSCDLKTSLPELNWKAAFCSLTRAAGAVSAPALSLCLCLCCMINFWPQHFCKITLDWCHVIYPYYFSFIDIYSCLVLYSVLQIYIYKHSAWPIVVLHKWF